MRGSLGGRGWDFELYEYLGLSAGKYGQLFFWYNPQAE